MKYSRILQRDPSRSCFPEVKGWVPTIPTDGATGADDETQNQMFRDLTNQKNDIMNALKACASKSGNRIAVSRGRRVVLDSSPQQKLVKLDGVVEGSPFRVGLDVAACRSVYDTLARFEG